MFLPDQMEFGAGFSDAGASSRQRVRAMKRADIGEGTASSCGMGKAGSVSKVSLCGE